MVPPGHPGYTCHRTQPVPVPRTLLHAPTALGVEWAMGSNKSHSPAEISDPTLSQGQYKAIWPVVYSQFVNIGAGHRPNSEHQKIG